MSSSLISVALGGVARAATTASLASVVPSGAALAAGIAPTAARALSAAAAGASFKLPELSYDYAELEPYISGDIMKLHHTKHHQAYITNLNAALEKYGKAEAAGDVAEMIALQGALRFNGGGMINHNIFFANLAPAGRGGGGEPEGELKAAIDARFGSFAEFKKQMTAASMSVQGSGWSWLGYNKTSSRLEIATCANQDPLSMTGLVPLLGFDVWEHAFYLQYKNMRADYLSAIWNVVNFGDVSKRLADAKKLA